ncbi:hypothetical protein ACFCV8_18240 [Streptomyces sp. NPDC056347]|uniref:hypothetical protein n=1 Tax=Streptomyces sp. NPDC056347 TaxID=3345790 RepID=UPI0035D559B8
MAPERCGGTGLALGGDADSATATSTTAKAAGFLPSTGTKGDHLALVHSADFGDVVLHANGVESARMS